MQKVGVGQVWQEKSFPDVYGLVIVANYERDEYQIGTASYFISAEKVNERFRLYRKANGERLEDKVSDKFDERFIYKDIQDFMDTVGYTPDHSFRAGWALARSTINSSGIKIG